MELAVGDPSPRVREHVRRAVDADDLVPASGEELGETAGPACGIQRHAGDPAAEALGHDRLVGCEQPAARLRVIAGGLLLVGGHGADALGEHAAVPQLLVIKQPPDLGQPGIDEFTVMLPSPGVKQRDAFQAEQVRKRVLIDHES